MSRHRRSRTSNLSCIASVIPNSAARSCASTHNCTRNQRSPMPNAIRINRDEHYSNTLCLSCGDELVRHLETYEHMLPTVRSKKVSEEKLLARIHELIGQLDIYEQALPPEAEAVPEKEFLATTHELVRLITEYEHAVTAPDEGATEEKRLSNQMLVERLKQMRRGL